MKNYSKKFIFAAIFTLVVFLGSASSASAFSLSLGFGIGGYNSYGYNSGYSYGQNNGYYNTVPINCFNSGYPCNGSFGGNNYGYYNNYGYGNTNNNYNTGCGYNCGGNYGYTMSSPTYFNTTSYYDYYPVRTPSYSYGSGRGCSMYYNGC